MGKVSNQLTGTASGKVGNLVYRKVKNGVSIVYPYNPDRKKPDTPAVIESNKKFALANKFAAAINDSKLLKTIWRRQRNIKGKSAYNKIHSYVSQYVHDDFLGKLTYILPGGIYNPINNFKHNDDSITVTILPSEELLKNIKGPFTAIFMLYLNSPASKRKGQKVFEHNAYLTVEKEFSSHNFKAGKLAKITSQKFKNQFRIIDEYRRVRVFLTLVFDSVSDKTMWTYNMAYTYKGVELDMEYDEKINKENLKRQKAAKKTKPSPKVFRLR